MSAKLNDIGPAPKYCGGHASKYVSTDERVADALGFLKRDPHANLFGIIQIPVPMPTVPQILGDKKLLTDDERGMLKVLSARTLELRQLRHENAPAIAEQRQRDSLRAHSEAISSGGPIVALEIVDPNSCAQTYKSATVALHLLAADCMSYTKPIFKRLSDEVFKAAPKFTKSLVARAEKEGLEVGVKGRLAALELACCLKSMSERANPGFASDPAKDFEILGITI